MRPTRRRKFLTSLLFKIVSSGNHLYFEEKICCFQTNTYAQAVRKCLLWGKEEEGVFRQSRAFPAEIHSFMGVLWIAEVHEPLKDGAEVTFHEHPAKSARRLLPLVFAPLDLMKRARAKDRGESRRTRS